MAKDTRVFWRHGEGAGGAAAGGAGEEATGDPTQSSASCFVSLNIFIPFEFIVSQGCCESRQIIYDHSAKSVL